MTQQGRGRPHALACAPMRPTQLLPVRLAFCALLLALVLPATSHAATYTFTPVADGYTRSDAATNSYGSSSRISDRDATTQTRISYLRFNVAMLAGDTITSATLRLYSTTSGSNVDLRDVTSDTWSESGLTWNSAPVHSSVSASRVSSFGKYRTVSFDATSLVAGPGLASMAMTTESASAVNFYSREAGSSRPQLVVQTALGAPDPVPPPPPPPADTTPPDTSITSAPAASTTSTTASFSFSGSDETSAPGALSFECSLDGTAYSPCSSIKTYSGLQVGSHSFGVRATDEAGNIDASPAQHSWQVTAPSDTTAPSAPAGLSATPGDGTVALSWSAATDDVGVTGYRVYRDGSQIATAVGTIHTDTGRTNGTTYSYTVTAVDAAGNVSAASSSASATPQAAGGSPVGGSLPARLPASTGSTYYVSTTGSDSSAGTVAAPWRTVQKALNTLTAGQTALVRAGTYAQNLTLTRAGSATAPITIGEYPGEEAILAAGTGASNNMPLQLGNGAAYARFQGLTFHGATGSSTTNIYAWGNAHDIELSNCEVRYSQRQGFFSEKTNSRIHIIGCRFHHNGGSGPVQLDHNIYIQGSYNAVLGNLLEGAVNGNGIQVYPSSDHVVIAGNTITGNFREGIIIGSEGSTTTSDSLIVNNVITSSQTAVSTYWGGATGSGNVARNNVAWGNTQGTFTGNGITYTANTSANPLYMNAGAGDYHLQSTSPALSIADSAYATPVDLDGLTRPLGGGPDLGAYER